MIGFAVGDAPASFDRGAPRVGESTDVRRIALFAALLGLALVPVLTTPIPAMVDYVNHLARMYELSAQGTSAASPFYQVSWRLYPNLAMDAVVPLLARWTSVEAATRLFLLASQLLVVSGSVALELRIKKRFSISGFVAVLYLFNIPFAWGFLNFEFALGIALWGIAAWLAVRHRQWLLPLAVHAAFVATLFASHLFALGLYGVTLGLHEAWVARRERIPLRYLLRTGLLLGTPAAAMAALMVAAGGSVGGSVNEWQLLGKPLWPFLLLNGDSLIVSVLGTVALACLLHAMVGRREVAFLDSGSWLAVGFAVLYLIIPSRMLDTAFADIRVLVGAVLILPAFVSIHGADKRQQRIAAAVVSGVTLLNLACVERMWLAYQPIYQTMIGSFARIGPGSRVLVSHIDPIEDPPFLHLANYPLYHAPTLAVHYARAFVPTLFTTPGKQPLTVAAGLGRLSYSCGGPISLDALRKIAAGDGSAAVDIAFARNWPRDFDYVYVLGSGSENPIPSLLKPVQRESSFTLYRVRQPTGQGSVNALTSP